MKYAALMSYPATHIRLPTKFLYLAVEESNISTRSRSRPANRKIRKRHNLAGQGILIILSSWLWAQTAVEVEHVINVSKFPIATCNKFSQQEQMVLITFRLMY